MIGMLVLSDVCATYSVLAAGADVVRTGNGPLLQACPLGSSGVLLMLYAAFVSC